MSPGAARREQASDFPQPALSLHAAGPATASSTVISPAWEGTCRHRADAVSAASGDAAAVGSILAGIQARRVDLPRSAPDQADLSSESDMGPRTRDSNSNALADGEGEIVDVATWGRGV